ncbi:MAG: hypothetical protein U1G07_24035, partial [Verrucomicrobiota bacterium]
LREAMNPPRALALFAVAFGLLVAVIPRDVGAQVKPLVGKDAGDWDPDLVHALVKRSLAGINRANYALWVAENVPDSAKRKELLDKLFEQQGGMAETLFDLFWSPVTKSNPAYFNMLAMLKFYQHPEKYENWQFFIEKLPVYESTVKLLKDDLFKTMDELNGVDKGTWQSWHDALDKLKKEHPALVKTFEVVGKSLDGEFESALQDKLKDARFRQSLDDALNRLEQNGKLKEWIAADPSRAQLVKDYLARIKAYLQGLAPDEKGNWLFDGESETIWHKLYRWRYGLRLRLSQAPIHVPTFDGSGAPVAATLSPDQILVRNVATALFQWDFGCWPNVSAGDIQQMLGIVAENSASGAARAFALQQRSIIQQRFGDGPERPQLAGEFVLGEARPSRFSVSQPVVLDSPTRQVFGVTVPYRFAQEYRPGLKGAALVVAVTEGSDWIFVDAMANTRVPGNPALVDRHAGEKSLAQLRTARFVPDDSDRLLRSEGRASWLDEAGAGARLQPAPEWFGYGFGTRRGQGEEDAARVYLHVHSLPGIWSDGGERRLTLRCAWSVQPIALGYQTVPGAGGPGQHFFRFVLPLSRKVTDIDEDARFYVYRAPRPAGGQEPQWENLTEGGLKVDESMLAAENKGSLRWRSQPTALFDGKPLLVAFAGGLPTSLLAQAHQKELKVDERVLTFTLNKDGVIECLFQTPAPARNGPYVYIAEQHYIWESKGAKEKPKLELHR